MGRLVISHHKSYHVYNRENIDKVRKDEAKELRRVQEEERRLQIADSERRLALLRGTALDEKQSSYSTNESIIVSQTQKKNIEIESASTVPTQLLHINFWPELEGKVASSSLSVSKKKKKFDEAQRTDNNKAEEDEWKGVALIDAAGPDGTGLKPWYATARTGSSNDLRKSKFQEMASKSDSSWKDKNDPLMLIKNGLKTQRDNRRRDIFPPEIATRSLSVQVSQSGHAKHISVDSASEANRAEALLSAHRQRERYGTPSSFAPTPRGDNWYEALHRR